MKTTDIYEYDAYIHKTTGGFTHALQIIGVDGEGHRAVRWLACHSPAGAQITHTWSSGGCNITVDYPWDGPRLPSPADLCFGVHRYLVPLGCWLTIDWEYPDVVVKSHEDFIDTFRAARQSDYGYQDGQL